MFVGLPTQLTLEPLATTKYVALASGLCIGEPAVDVPKTMMLIDWVKGLLGDADQCKDVVRLVICGTYLLTYFLVLARSPDAAFQCQTIQSELRKATVNAIVELCSGLN